MADHEALDGQHQPRLRDHVRAWWLAALAGHVDQSYPVRGAEIQARVDGATLVVEGAVPTAHDRDELARTVEQLRGFGIDRIRMDVAVVGRSEEQSGLLVQTIVATFASPVQARLAQHYLTGRGHIRPSTLRLLDGKEDGLGEDEAALLGDMYVDDVRRALHEGQSVLIVTVDETEAFEAREILDEELQSQQTVVLPPAAAETARIASAEDRPAEAANDRAARVADRP